MLYCTLLEKYPYTKLSLLKVGLFYIWVLWAVSSTDATAESVPFLSSEMSVFSADAPSQPARNLNFVLPDSNLTIQGMPGLVTLPIGLNTNFPGILQNIIYFSYGSAVYDSPGMGKAPDTVECQGSTITGGAGVTLVVTSQMLVMMSDNIQDELTDRIIPKFKAADVTSYSIQDATITMRVKGGGFDGSMVKLHGTMASGTGEDPTDDTDYSDSWQGDMFIALDWGIDPLGNHEYLLLRFTYVANADGADPDCLPMQHVCQYYFGQDSVQAFFMPEWQSLVAQASDPNKMFLDGAIPDLLFLYDFSGSKTVTPSQTLPPGMLNPMTVIPPSYTPDTNVFKYINQYNAGVAFNLPKRFSRPNPVPKYTPGGNACGPTSLGMMLFANGVSSVDAKLVFDNTTDQGLGAPDNSANGFYWDRAYTWLAGKPASGSQKAFSAPSPLPNVNAAHEGTEVTGDSLTGKKFTTIWNQIDGLLSYKQPVEIRTDLGLGAGAGGGHCILLLGVGHNDDLKQIYPSLSGDYYIVADPAGNYFANPSGDHYNLVDALKVDDVGINYGGWFAMYPKELLRARISDTSDSVSWNFRSEALTIGSPFHTPSGKVKVHSPVTLIITDPIGRQAGIMTNGTVISQIPSSYYQIALSDEEEDGGVSIDPDGPKALELDDPMDGIYQIQLTGTNNGSYIVEWAVLDTNTTVVISQTNSGVISTGQLRSYVINFNLGGVPTLQFLAITNSIALFWPTNAAGYDLQTSTNVSNPNSWMTVAGSFALINGENAFTNSLAGTSHFFRLKK
jgi:hypothetical protein